MKRPEYVTLAEQFVILATSPNPEQVALLSDAQAFANCVQQYGGRARLIDLLRPLALQRGWHVVGGSPWFAQEQCGSFYVAFYPVSLAPEGPQELSGPVPDMRLFGFTPGSPERPLVQAAVVDGPTWQQRLETQASYRNAAEFDDPIMERLALLASAATAELVAHIGDRANPHQRRHLDQLMRLVGEIDAGYSGQNLAVLLRSRPEQISVAMGQVATVALALGLSVSQVFAAAEERLAHFGS